MPAHDEILRAANRLCRDRRGWRFRPVEIVQALPHLDPGTIRTHVVSRCCVNAPTNHPHKWNYFERVARGVYEVRRRYRDHGGESTRAAAEPRARYDVQQDAAPRDTVHAVVHRGGGWYVAECLEIAVATQGRTLDDVVVNLREAVALHLQGGSAATLGLVPSPRLTLTYELPSRRL